MPASRSAASSWEARRSAGPSQHAPGTGAMSFLPPPLDATCVDEIAAAMAAHGSLGPSWRAAFELDFSASDLSPPAATTKAYSGRVVSTDHSRLHPAAPSECRRLTVIVGRQALLAKISTIGLCFSGPLLFFGSSITAVAFHFAAPRDNLALKAIGLLMLGLGLLSLLAGLALKVFAKDYTITSMPLMEFYSSKAGKRTRLRTEGERESKGVNPAAAAAAAARSTERVPKMELFTLDEACDVRCEVNSSRV